MTDIEHHTALGYRGPNGVVPWLFRCSQGGHPGASELHFDQQSWHADFGSDPPGEGLALLPFWGVSDGLSDGSLEEVVVSDGEFIVSTGPDMSIFLLYDSRKAR